MLSILTKIKNSIIFLNRGSVNKTKQNSLYNSQQMFVNDSDDSNKESRSSESIHDNNNTVPIIRYLFKTPLTKDTIDTDYELQELIKLVELYVKDDLSDIVLDSKFETCIRDISSDITKIKMRLFYIIIANNIYKHTFEEKKLYAPDKTKHLTGVFRYSGYIFRIDESPYSLIDEQHAVLRIKELTEKNKNIPDDEYRHIVLPFVSYVNIKRNDKGHICDCRAIHCNCVYEEPDVYGSVDTDAVADELIDFAWQTRAVKTIDLKPIEGSPGLRAYKAMENGFHDVGMMVRITADTIALSPPLIAEFTAMSTSARSVMVTLIGP